MSVEGFDRSWMGLGVWVMVTIVNVALLVGCVLLAMLAVGLMASLLP